MNWAPEIMKKTQLGPMASFSGTIKSLNSFYFKATPRNISVIIPQMMIPCGETSFTYSRKYYV